jgi:NAD-dependent deacetylase
MEEQAKRCAQLIKKADSIVFMTGAGISTNAGIPDFRGPKGLYVTKRYDADTVFDINAFRRDPRPFFDFARDFIGLEGAIQPTFTHRFLAGLEDRAHVKGVITQNIDSLHQRSGSKRVIEVHGSFWRSFCTQCAKEFTYAQAKTLILENERPCCACGGIVKPDIVFFGENVKGMEEAIGLAGASDLFFIIGSSCVVYPAAFLPEYANGAIVVVNQGKLGIDPPNIAMHVNYDIDQFFRKVAEYV